MKPYYFEPWEIEFLRKRADEVEYTTERGAYKMAPFDPSATLPTPSKFLELREPYGCYIIRYGVGAEKTAHLDPVPEGFAHERVLLLLQNADQGGDLVFNGGRVRLCVGGSVWFRADLEEHAVLPVLEGERIILTIGRLVPP